MRVNNPWGMQMFASGQPSSEKRTTLLLRMIRDTVEAVNEQLANIGGRRKKAGRPGRALDSLSSFASVSRAQQAYNAHEAGVVAAADACRGWEGGDGDWALGIGVLPATDGSCIRCAVSRISSCVAIDTAIQNRSI